MKIFLQNGESPRLLKKFEQVIHCSQEDLNFKKISQSAAELIFSAIAISIPTNNRMKGMMHWNLFPI